MQNGKLSNVPTAGGAKGKSQVEAGMEMLNAAVMSTNDSVMNLRDSLGSVLLPENPTEEKVKEPQTLRAPLAYELEEIYNRAARTNEMVIDILQRLEL